MATPTAPIPKNYAVPTLVPIQPNGCPLDEFTLYSFGRKVRRAPTLNPEKIESIGVTLADKKAGPFALELRNFMPNSTPREHRAQLPDLLGPQGRLDRSCVMAGRL